jgi:thioredoxin-like negative regulator of GroEL
VSGLAQRYQGKVRFLRINIDASDSQPFLKQFNVRGTPTIVLLDRQGRVAANAPGWPGDQSITAALDRLEASP